jgi:hypothetical protein
MLSLSERPFSILQRPCTQCDTLVTVNEINDGGEVLPWQHECVSEAETSATNDATYYFYIRDSDNSHRIFMAIARRVRSTGILAITAKNERLCHELAKRRHRRMCGNERTPARP